MSQKNSEMVIVENSIIIVASMSVFDFYALLKNCIEDEALGSMIDKKKIGNIPQPSSDFAKKYRDLDEEIPERIRNSKFRNWLEDFIKKNKLHNRDVGELFGARTGRQSINYPGALRSILRPLQF